MLRGEPLGLLHGLPTGIKDLDETGGLLTTYGSPLYRDFVPERDNAMVARVRAAGAIVVGKTNVPEFGAGANTPQRRLGRDRQSVRSRCSMPAALRAGRRSRSRRDMLPVCTGSDTGGSLRIPAAKCGVVGFRPSPGSGAGGAARAGLDADLGRRARWAARSPTPACCWRRRRRWTTAIRCPIRSTARAFACPRRATSGSLRVAYTEDFGVSPGRRADTRSLSRQDRGDAAPASGRATRSRSISARRTAAST